MFYSQYGQDKYLETNIFKGYKNGFYVDVGSHDGIIINNTLYFEKIIIGQELILNQSKQYLISWQ